MSFTQHKMRLFRDAGDAPLVLRKRSEGRMKTYPSATDARSWCYESEERRQYILDLIKADHDKSAVGKYVPIEVLIDTLLANKNADIERLRRQVEELQRLLDMYAKLDLTEDQKRMLSGMQREVGKAGAKLETVAGISSMKSPRIFELSEDSEAYATEDVEESSGRAGQDVETRSTCSALSRASKKPDAGAGTATEGSESFSTEYDESDLKSVVINKDAEIISLKNALNAKEAECEQQRSIAHRAIQQLEVLKDIMEERDHLRQQLEESKHEIQTLRSRVEDPCVGEIAALEQEIDRLRQSGQLSPDEETEIIRKEIEVLKKYCAKLGSIQEENSNLKTQVQRIQELSGIPTGYEDEEETSNNPAELKSRLKDLKRKFAKFMEVMEERDKLKQRVNQLETELLKYGELPEEIEAYKRRSQMLDDVLDERNNLQQRLQNLIGIEEELIALKKKADRVAELERQLAELTGEIGSVRRSSAAEIENLKSVKDNSSKETDSLKAERDMLRMKVADMATIEEELERLKYRAKEAEVLRIERDRMKVRLDELAAIECEYMQLLDKTRCLETIKAEKEMYKAKYEELLGLECECDMLRAQVEHYKQLDRERECLLRQLRDCECCIADQEDEIKKLVVHVDRLSQGSNQQQDRMQKALSDMRAELEKKTSLIATSEEQLAGMQSDLKSTIDGVTCETSCLRARIEELEDELNSAREELKKKREEIQSLKGSVKDKDSLIHSLHEDRKSSVQLKQALSSKNEIIASKEKLLEELQAENDRLLSMSSKGASFEGDEHLQQMLRQSKCAVRKVAEELSKHYQEWDCMKGRVFDDDDDYDAKEAENEHLLAKYSEQKRLSMELSDDVEKLKERIRQLEEELVKANETIARLREELAGGDRLQIENQALRRHSTEVQEVAKEQIEELVDHLKKANDRIAELEAQLAAERSSGEPDKCDELEAENKRLQSMLQELQSGSATDLASLQLKLISLQEQLDKEMKLRLQAETQLQESEDRIANLNKELNSMADNMQEKSRRSTLNESELQAELLRLKAENDQLKENMKMADEGATRRTSQIASELDVLSAQNKQLLQDKLNLENENASLRQQLEMLKAEAGDTSELDKLRAERDALLKQIEDQKNEINDMLAKLGEPVATGEDVDLEKERREKEELQNMIKNLQGQLNDMGAAPVPDDSALRRKISELEAENDDLRAQLASVRRFSQEMEESYQDKLRTSDKSFKDLEKSYQEKLETSGQSLKDLEKSLKLSADDQAVLQQMKESYESRIAELLGKLEKQKKDCDDKLREYEEALHIVRSQHDQDVKSLRSKYSDSIAKLQGSHEDVLKDINEVYENEVESLRSELRSSKETIETLIKKSKTSKVSSHEKSTSKVLKSVLSVKTIDNVDIKASSKTSADTLTVPQKAAEICKCGRILEEILQRVINSGFEALTFDELQLLHTRVCDARAAMMETQGISLPPSSMPTPAPVAVSAYSGSRSSPREYATSRRFSNMENDLMQKQKMAQQKVGALQQAVHMERQRLEELKHCLEAEKQRNCELMCKIGAQSRAVASLRIERDLIQERSSLREQKVQKLIATCQNQKSQVYNLEQDLSRQKCCVHNLQNALEAEKSRKNEALQNMQLKLEKSINSEMMLKMQLDQKGRGRPVPATCQCQRSGALTQPPQSQTTSFYTELSVQDARKKRNFVHHCCMKQRNHPVRRSLSAQPSSSRTSEIVEIEQ